MLSIDTPMRFCQFIRMIDNVDLLKWNCDREHDIYSCWQKHFEMRREISGKQDEVEGTCEDQQDISRGHLDME